MAVLTLSEIQTQIDTLLLDNTTAEISAEDLRSVLTDLNDSLAFATLANIPNDLTDAEKDTVAGRLGYIRITDRVELAHLTSITGFGARDASGSVLTGANYNDMLSVTLSQDITTATGKNTLELVFHNTTEDTWAELEVNLADLLLSDPVTLTQTAPENTFQFRVPQLNNIDEFSDNADANLFVGYVSGTELGLHASHAIADELYVFLTPIY